MKASQNKVDAWISDLPKPGNDVNKYDRGHVIILGGEDMTGAARLASEASMRTGCGVCTIVSSRGSRDIYLSGAPHIMFESYRNLKYFSDHLTSARRTTCIIGPGAGQKNTRELRVAILSALKTTKSIVLDADALNVFEGRTEELFSALHKDCVLTPHEGEFDRIFPDLSGIQEDRAFQAAKLTGANIVLKGAQTVIATPAEVIVNNHAAPWLATAGAGDVLAGMIGGLLAQGMVPFKACAAGVWIHGEAGIQLGAGLVAPDIIAAIPKIIKNL